MTSDTLLTELLTEMHTLIDARRRDMSTADLENAMAWVQS